MESIGYGLDQHLSIGLFVFLLSLTSCRHVAYGATFCKPCMKTCLFGYAEDYICATKCECDKKQEFVDDMRIDPNVRNFMIKNMGTDDELVPFTAVPHDAVFDASRADVVNRWTYPAATTNWSIPYIIGNVSSEMTSLINEAIADYETNICMDFVERTTEESYIHLMDNGRGGCWSYVGRRYDGINYINLDGSQCAIKGTVIHEILHAMGFFHEHQRPDRDDYVIIVPSAIAPGAHFNFEKLNYDTVDRFISTSVPYDLRSVMQYYDDAFSLLGDKTLTDINGNGLDMVQRVGFADSDILQLRLMYECDGIIDPNTTPSKATNLRYSSIICVAGIAVTTSLLRRTNQMEV